MTLGAFLTILSLVALVLFLPIWPWSRRFGYQPAIMLAVFTTFVILLWVGLVI